MKPIQFKQQTAILNKPKGMTDDECQGLPVHQADNGECISLWQATWKERLIFLFTGRVWLYILSGKTQPPVFIGAEKPWVK